MIMKKQNRGISTRHNPSVSSKTATAGITLIALVITIIVLLILAGVSIATLTGENGILTQAEDAKNETTRAEAREMIQLETAASFDNKGKYNVDTAIENLKNNAKISAGDITKNDDGTLTVKLYGYKFEVDKKGKVDKGTKIGDNLTPPELPKTVKEAKEKETVFDDNTKLTDTYGNPITIPEGFKIASDSAIDVAQGVVIEDAKYSGTIGSQFVWIPVGTVTGKVNGVKKTETITLGRYDFTENSNGTVTTSAHSGGYVEENSKDIENLLNYDNAIAEDIEEFKTSTGVDKNGGYYIGRYEAGLDTSNKLDITDQPSKFQAPNNKWTGWSKQDGTEAQIVCKQGQQVWNYITQNKASELSKNMYSSDLAFTSDLINSYAWDTALVFIQTFGEETNSSTYSIKELSSTNTSEPQKTGTNIFNKTGKVDRQCNIFDIAGNTREWTTETYNRSNIPHVTRSASYIDFFDNLYPGDRVGTANNAGSYTSFRPIIYL